MTEERDSESKRVDNFEDGSHHEDHGLEVPAESLLSKEKNTNQGEGNGFMKAAKSQALRPFVIISSSYLLFTITDGAIRMIVLQHAYSKSFSAMQVAIMFTLYELAGVFTNLVSKTEGFVLDCNDEVLTICETKGCRFHGCEMGYQGDLDYRVDATTILVQFIVWLAR